MQRSRSFIFRNEALEYYIQSREKQTLPRITRPPVLLCMWMLLGLCVATIATGCLGQLPVYVNGVGVVREQGPAVLVFFPTSSAYPLHIHIGAPVHVQIGTSSQTIHSTIDQVETGMLSPDDVRRRYGLGDKVSQIMTGPSIVASVKLSPSFSVRSYAGSFVNVQVQVGTASVFSLLLNSAASNGE